MSHSPGTPSPHRFIVKKAVPSKKTPLAQEHTPQRPSFTAPPSSAHQFTSTPRPSTQQFNATPRFNYASTPRLTQEPPASTPRYATPARPILNANESIEISSDELSQEFHDSLETGDENLHLQGDYEAEVDQDDYAIDIPTPKRRRLSPSLTPTEDDNVEPDLSSSQTPILSSPPAPRPQLTSAAPRFKIATPAPSLIPQPILTQQSTFAKAPRFRPPDPSTQTQSNSEPLPDQFSPHRRGQKYVAGGLAAEVREWLVNLDSAISTNTGHKNMNNNGWAVRIIVDEISGGGRAGMTLIRGRHLYNQVDAAESVNSSLGGISIALAGEGALTGLQKSIKPELGSVIGIKGPMWEIMIDEEKWGVGVDWKVLP